MGGPRALASFWAPEGRERETWPPTQRALDLTMTEGAWHILEQKAPTACRTADPKYNAACLVPARLAALKRLSRGDWPWPYRGTNLGPDARPEAQVVLAAEIVRQAGLEPWELEDAIYEPGGAFGPLVIGVDVPGGGTVNVRLNPDGTYQDPPELKARALAYAECMDLERQMRAVAPWDQAEKGRLEDAFNACVEVVRQMPFPTSQDVPGVTWTPPEQEPEPEPQGDDGQEPVGPLSHQDPDRVDVTGDDLDSGPAGGESPPEPAKSPKRKRKWLPWVLGGAAAAALVIVGVVSSGSK